MAAAAAGTEEEGLPILSEKQSTKAEQPEKGSEAGAICAAIVVLILSIAGAVYLSIGAVHLLGGHWRSWFGPYDPVEYTVTIAAFSGLDPAKDLQRHGSPPAAAAALLYPAFNLTLHAASPRTAARRECVKPGTTVEVSYLRPSSSAGGVPLAAGTAPAFCVEAGERRDEGSVVAWGDGVRLPGLLLDSLAADMTRSAAEFGVKLTPLPDCGARVGARVFCSDTVDVISCWAKVAASPKKESSSRRRRAVASGRTRRRQILHSQRRRTFVAIFFTVLQFLFFPFINGL